MVATTVDMGHRGAEIAPTDRAGALTRGWHHAFRDLPREHGFEPLEVEGVLPADLRGTLYRNGGVLFGNHGHDYGHWFDCDGGVSAVRFESGRAEGAARVVRSRGLTEERAAGKQLHGGFGTVGRGRRRFASKPKNAANTSVMTWNDRLFALFEAGLPTELSADDLTTIGETDLGGIIPQAFSAHPHAVASRRAIYNFGVRYGRVTHLDVFEMPLGGGSVRRLCAVPLSGPTVVHDFIATDKHLIFFVPPLRLRAFRTLLGIGTVSENLRWVPELGTEIIVIPIDAPQKVVRFTTDAFYMWHTANAFDASPDQIVVDLVRYPDYRSNEWLGHIFAGREGFEIDGTFHRLTIDLSTHSLKTEEVWDKLCEFPKVSPRVEGRSHRYVYAAAHSSRAISKASVQDCIVRLDMETGQHVEVDPGDEQYPSEPIFVPRAGGSGEDDGFVLSLIYDARRDRSGVAVFDARALEAGPLGRAWFDHHLPFTFHGFFA